MTTTVGVVNYVYDAANRLLVSSSPGHSVSYTWDDNGNLLNDGLRTYTYDHANRLAQVVSGTLTTEFAYDGAGDRVARIVDGVTTDYVLDPAAGLTQVLQETTASQTTSYLYGHDLLAQYDSGTWAYHVNDGLGSVRQLADPMGQLVASYSFSPFGVPLGQSGGEPSGFTGEQWDASTGLVFLRARYYQPKVGRFISKDPFPGYAYSPQSLNRWIYVRNNPVGLVDPSGLQEPVPVPTPGPPVAPEGTPTPRLQPPPPRQQPTLPPGVPTPPQPAGTPTPSPEFAHYLEWTEEIGEHSDADLTDWLVREMRANVNGPIADFIRTNLWHWEDSPCGNPISGLTAYTLWYDAVKTHGIWDFKHRIRKEVGESIRLAGQWYRFDVPGNIFYGYMGVAIGFDEQMLHCGAGFAAIRAGTGTTTDWRQVCKADAPEDREAVEAGFDLWKQARSNATGDALKAALAGHPLIATSAPPSEPVPNPHWPYPIGYFNDGTTGWFFK